jgi:hypothetical protein
VQMQMYVHCGQLLSGSQESGPSPAGQYEVAFAAATSSRPCDHYSSEREDCNGQIIATTMQLHCIAAKETLQALPLRRRSNTCRAELQQNLAQLRIKICMRDACVPPALTAESFSSRFIGPGVVAAHRICTSTQGDNASD